MTRRTFFAASVAAVAAQEYEDGRPPAKLRLEAKDHGLVLKHGDAFDYLGARDVSVWQHRGKYYMHYDAAGPDAWLSALAVSTDLVNWTKKGPILPLGPPGSDDSKSASYGVTYFDGHGWHMFYLGTPNTSPVPDRVPAFPYMTMKAHGESPEGPWTKTPNVVPFRPQAGSYTSVTASPGYIVKRGREYLQFFSAATQKDKKTYRTLSIARTRDLNGSWTVNPEPILPLSEQIENSSLYFEPTNLTWFLFTNHVGIRNKYEYTDAVWVYWSRDLEKWNPENKAVVIDPSNCNWSRNIIGLPSVVKAGNKLAVFYDGQAGNEMSHMRRDIGLAWLDLPLKPPVSGK